MIPTAALILEAIITIAAGVITDSPLTSAIIGGLFLIVSATINSITLYLIARDERKRDIARAKKRNRRSETTARSKHRHSLDRGSSPDTRSGGSDRPD